MIRTDLANELIKPKYEFLHERIKRTVVNMDETIANKLHKQQGKYLTIDTDIILKGDKQLYKHLTKVLIQSLAIFCKNKKNILVVGLGNPHLTADTFGTQTVEKIIATRHIKQCKTKLSTLIPNVLGVTGIESFDVIKGVVDKLNFDLVIIVDSLCANSYNSLCSCLQITDSGITPGSGVNNHRYTLSKSSLGVDVVCIGLPTVVYYHEVIKNSISEHNFIVTPKDIDELIQDSTDILSESINTLFLS